MKVVDSGHEYDLDSYDGGDPVRLTFVKREGEGYPFNVGHHPGTNCQEVIRALINRVQYLQRQIPCGENIVVIEKLREALWQFEQRAAERHGRILPPFQADIETLPTCAGCGHIGCTGEGHHKHSIDTPPTSTSDNARRAANRERAQEIVIATEHTLGKKFDALARHELADRIAAALDAAAPADNDAESKGESDA